MAYANLELYDGEWLFDDDVTWSKAVMLLHDSDHPFWQLGLQLEQILTQAEVALTTGSRPTWQSRYVGAYLIKWSTEDLMFAVVNQIVPLLPCLTLHRG